MMTVAELAIDRPGRLLPTLRCQRRNNAANEETRARRRSEHLRRDPLVWHQSNQADVGSISEILPESSIIWSACHRRYPYIDKSPWPPGKATKGHMGGQSWGRRGLPARRQAVNRCWPPQRAKIKIG